jgi:neutral ceramidase
MLMLMLCAALAATMLPGGPDDPAPLLAGVAETEITPPATYRRLGGYFKERFYEEVKDPLYARALALAQGSFKSILLSSDLCGVPGALARPVREELSRRSGIPAERITVTASHTHTGPYLYNGMGAPEILGAGAETEYSMRLKALLVEVGLKALEDLRAADLRTGSPTQWPAVSRNRRNLFKDGQVRSIGPVTRDLPDHQASNIVANVGPIDPELGLLVVGDPGSEKPRACLSVFALHCNTVGNTRVGENAISADFPGAMMRALRKEYGPAFIAMFGAGTCGDLNYVDPHVQALRSHEEIGALLAATAVKAMPQLRRLEAPSLALQRSVLECPLRKCTVEEVAKSRKDIADASVPFYAKVQAHTILELSASPKPTYPIEIQALRLSKEAGVVFLPGEVFVELGLEIKQRSPFRTTHVIELANDSTPVYIPTRKACAQNGYEVFHSLLAPGSGELMVEEALRLLAELAR